MNFRHPVFLTLLFAIILVLVGLYVVERQRAVAPHGGSETWESVNGYIDSPATVAQTEQTSLPDTPAVSNPETLVIPAAATATVQKRPTPKDDGTFDYNALLAQLRHDTGTIKAPQAQTTFDALIDAFSFTPTVTVPASRTRTPEQQAVFAYGNEVGARLKGFAAVNPNMAQTLTDQVTHRTDSSKGNAVRELGNRYRALGEGILAMQDVPPAIASAHDNLGQSYIHLGEALRSVPDATEDQAFLKAITAYNNTADAYTTAFIGMVTLFSALNVTFDEADAGSVFSFRRN